VDNPHLATLAEQAKVQDYVTDPRLAPIVRAVLEAAFAGDQPGEGELLELIDPAAHRQLHDALFNGTFRDLEHPQQVLDSCIYDCQRDELRHSRHARRRHPPRDRARRAAAGARALAEAHRREPAARRARAPAPRLPPFFRRASPALAHQRLRAPI
jgi:hypothetical protein